MKKEAGEFVDFLSGLSYYEKSKRRYELSPQMRSQLQAKRKKLVEYFNQKRRVSYFRHLSFRFLCCRLTFCLEGQWLWLSGRAHGSLFRGCGFIHHQPGAGLLFASPTLCSVSFGRPYTKVQLRLSI